MGDTAFCSTAGMGCDGGNSAWDWLTEEGVCTGGDYTDIGSGKTCLPYSLAPCAHHVPATIKYPKCPSSEYPSPRCTGKCSEKSYATSKKQDKVKAKRAFSVRGVSNIQKELMTNGPLYVAFTVYADFPTYKSGVYKHTTGSSRTRGMSNGVTMDSSRSRAALTSAASRTMSPAARSKLHSAAFCLACVHAIALHIFH